MRGRRVALISIVGVVAGVLVVVGATQVLNTVDSDRAETESTSSTLQGDPRVPQWLAEVPVQAAGNEGDPVGGEGFRPLGGVLLGDDAVFLDASAGSLLSVSAIGRLTETHLEAPRAEGVTTPRFTDLAVSGEGNLLVTDLANGQIWLYSSAGRFLGSLLTAAQKEAAALVKPTSIVVDTLGRILVADVGDQRIKVFNRLGEPQASWGGEGFAPGKFSYPSDLAVDQRGLLFVADSENRRVQVLDRDGRFVRAFRDTDTTDGLVLPRALAVDDRSQVHVVDTFADRVSVFSMEGEFRFSYGQDEGASRVLALPEGIVVERARVIVGDRGNGRFAVFAW